MIDVFLIVVTIIIIGVILGINIYTLILWQHPDDKNEAYIPKAFVIFGFTIAQGTILLIPLDVANQTNNVACTNGWISNCGGLDMHLFWDLAYCTIAICLIVFVPFLIFYYEEDDGMLQRDGTPSRPLHTAIGYEICVLIICCLVIFLMYYKLGTTKLPIKQIGADASTSLVAYSITNHTNVAANLAVVTTADKFFYKTTSDVLEIKVTLPIYVASMLSFFGWFFFLLFSGVGLVFLPVDLIRDFIFRPKHLDAAAYADRRFNLQRRTQELMEVAETFRRERDQFFSKKPSRWERSRRANADRVTINKLKQMVFMLVEDNEELQLCHKNYQSYNPLIPYFKFFLGIIFGFVSILWVIHIIVYILPEKPFSLFLNTYFIFFDGFFPLFGTLSVLLFTWYLLAAVVKGAFKFGVRFFCISLHPMKYGGTYMNSFLFNVGLVLLCVMPVVQFSSAAFLAYTRFTSFAQIFGVQMKYLIFLVYFFQNKVFIYAMVCIMGLCSFYVAVKPGDEPEDPNKLKSALDRKK